MATLALGLLNVQNFNLLCRIFGTVRETETGLRVYVYTVSQKNVHFFYFSNNSCQKLTGFNDFCVC